MRAIQFETFGDPSVLELAEVTTPAVDARTALVRVMAASINPSDVKNVEGAMKQTTLPRIPGRDYAGRVEAVRRNGSEPRFGARAAIRALPAMARMRS
jgi:NADPH2:quinone reductase